DPVTMSKYHDTGSLIKTTVRYVKHSELGARFMEHFLDGTGKPVDYDDGSDVSNLVQRSHAFRQADNDLQVDVKFELDKLRKAGKPIDAATVQKLLNRFKKAIVFDDEANEPDLF